MLHIRNTLAGVWRGVVFCRVRIFLTNSSSAIIPVPGTKMNLTSGSGTTSTHKTIRVM